jgi:hypothetical protein
MLLALVSFRAVRARGANLPGLLALVPLRAHAQHAHHRPQGDLPEAADRGHPGRLLKLLEAWHSRVIVVPSGAVTSRPSIDSVTVRDSAGAWAEIATIDHFLLTVGWHKDPIRMNVH